MDNRISWDEYFLNIAEAVSLRSLDPSTKHGTVIVDNKNHIISTGYNGPIRGIDDSKIDWTRPNKYAEILHSEENSILHSRQDLTGCTAYITGRPCHRCLRMMIQAGIKKIIYGDRSSKCIDEDDLRHSNKMVELSGIELIEYKSKDDKDLG